MKMIVNTKFSGLMSDRVGESKASKALNVKRGNSYNLEGLISLNYH